MKKPPKIKKKEYRYFTETRLLPTFHSVVLNVQVFQTEVEFLQFRSSRLFLCEIRILSFFIKTLHYTAKTFVLD